MSKIISVHSFKCGVGKSNITASLATLMAAEGKRVGVIDTNIQSPGINVLFRLHADKMKYSLNDYLWGRCDILDAVYDVTSQALVIPQGKVYLVPCSIRAGDIARVLREGYDVGLLNDGFHRLVEALNLDALLIDTHPGLNEETFLSLAISDVFAILMRADEQDYQGTGVILEVARKLDVSRLVLVMNQVSPIFNFAEVKRGVESIFNCPVAAVLPYADEMRTLGSGGLFVLNYPDHSITGSLKIVASTLLV